MRTTILTLTAALVLTGGLWLRAQRSDEGSTGTLTGSQEGKTAMDEQCRHMCATQYNPESPASLLAWKQELNLTDDQAAKTLASHQSKWMRITTPRYRRITP
jgi:hypothetical protein